MNGVNNTQILKNNFNNSKNGRMNVNKTYKICKKNKLKQIIQIKMMKNL